MRVCVVGSGGREHALAHVLGRDAEVVVTPGNPGIPGSVATPPEEIDADLFVVGPEAPLVDGLADRLRSASRRVFGPGADGARLEGSKAWMKEVLVKAGVPTARHGAFTDEAAALAFLDVMSDLFVVKTDGLAAGKGVLVTEDRDEAADAVRSYLSGDAFGDAGRTVVIEEGLTGPELSLLAICDGRTAVPLAPAQDYKRIGDGDAGPNTGGMGAYSPVPVATDAIVDSLMDDAVGPTLAALRRQGIDYRGVLYCGLMFTPTRRCSNTTCASATRRPRSCCHGWRAASPTCWRPLPRAPWVPHRSSTEAPPSRSSAPPTGTRHRHAPVTRSTGSRRPTPSTTSPCSAPVSAAPTAGSPPPEAACWP